MNPTLTACLLLFSLLALAAAPGSSRAAEPATAAPAVPAAGPTVPVYVGSYTKADAKGIHLMRLDTATGTLGEPQAVAETPNPTYLALHPSKRFLFAINEIDKFDGKSAGSVTGFSIEPGTGKLTAINRQSSGGPGPCHLSFDAAGKNVLIANYGGGSVEVVPVDEDGKMAEPSCFIQHDTNATAPNGKKRQPHGHCIEPDPAGKFVLCDDLGLDKILVYRFDGAKGVLTPNDPPAADTAAGAGPRHLAFHPDGKFVYNINELNSTLGAYAYDAAKGTLAELQTLSTLPPDFKGKNSCAEVQVHPSGKFVYGSNRGHDSIAAFAIDPGTGKLTLIGHTPTGGKTPRNFALDPTGRWLLAANQDTGNVVVFKVDGQTGKLEPTGQKVEVSAPVCVTFVP